MIIFLNKKRIYNCIFAFALIFAFSVYLSGRGGSVSVIAPAVSGKIIIIDPGHGSPDGGTSGKSGVLEKDLNLSVAKKLGSYLQKSGAHVIYTREDDDSLASDSDGSIRQKKIADLKMRKEIRDNPDADVFISIHMNYFTDPAYKGAQVFYTHASDESKKLAQSVQKSLKTIADDSNLREAKDSQNLIFLLNNSQIPSVLVECGFLSNEEEEKKLLSDSYQDKVAYAIYGGVLQYINSIR